MSDYNRSYKKRIIIFLVITGLYLLFTAAYTITDLFFFHISWSDNGFLYAYCTYAIWFNGYSYYRYHQNSVEEERKFVPDPEFKSFLEEKMGLPQFNHKKARRHIFLLSSFAIAINVFVMIATRWVW